MFGLVGLHPCGDLAPTLLQLFSACEEAKFISIVGCCYMKMTTKSCVFYLKSKMTAVMMVLLPSSAF